MSGSQTVQMQPHQENMATSIEHLNTKPEPTNEMMNNIMDSYQDMEIQENEDDNPEEIYNRRMMNDVNEPPDLNQPQMRMDNQPMQHEAPPIVKDKSMINKLIDSVKSPLIVMIVFFVLNQGFIVNTVNSILKGYLSEESNYHMYGLILRSVLSAVLFYALNFFS
jgi:hypothetical protein